MNPEERDFILDKARSLLDWATGAHYCECVVHHGPAKGFRTTRNPECKLCGPGGMISNPGWDGTREHFDALLPQVKSTKCTGTARIRPGDRVGPGGKFSYYAISAKGITLTRDGEPDVSMTWRKILEGLSESAQMEMAL